jgi:hypothetical protein
MDEAFVAHVDHELGGLDRILHANFDASTMQGPTGFLSRCWFLLKQFRLGIAVTIAVCLFVSML